MRRIIDVALIALVVLGIVLAAWGRTRSSGTGEVAVSTTVDDKAGDVRFPDDMIVWQTAYENDTYTPVAKAASRPSATIYGDGRIFLTEPGRNPQYDQPLSFQQGKIDRRSLAMFLAGVQSTDLFNPNTDFGTPAAEDVTTMRLDVQGIGDPKSVTVQSLGGRFDAGVTAQQAERREALRQVLSGAEGLVPIREREPYIPERVRILHLRDDAEYMPVLEDVDGHILDLWTGPGLDTLTSKAPKSLDGVEVLGCGELGGDAAATLLEAAIANPTPRWDVDGKERSIIVVPLLPGEAACG